MQLQSDNQTTPEKRKPLASPVLLAVLVGFLCGMFVERAYRNRLAKAAPQAAQPTNQPPAEAAPSRITDLEDPNFLAPLASPDPNARRAVLSDFALRSDHRIIAPLLLLMWAGNVGIIPELAEEELGILKKMTSQDFGSDWGEWMEWWWTQEAPEPHPGYAFLHASLSSAIDASFGALLHPQLPARIRRDEIIWGGVGVDGIPALIGPSVVAADSEAASAYSDEEPVFGVAFQGQARAYPLRIMDWHEMVNDTLGDQRFAIAYCTLCGAAVAYDTHVDGVGRLIFGSSGLLRRSNKLMYDRQSRTLWTALEGEPVIGPLAAARPDYVLRRLPIVRSTWGEWKRAHPQTTVLSLETGYQRDYTPDKAYGEYFASPDPMFPVMPRSDVLKAKDWIYGIILEGKPKAYPISAFEAQPVIQDDVSGRHIVLIGHAERLEVRAYQTDGRAFVWDATERALKEKETGGVWKVTEESLQGGGGQRFSRLPGHLAFWFGWYAAFETTEVYRP